MKLGSMQSVGEEVEHNRTFSLEGIMKGINKNEFYSYLGSLSKPACDESVIWIVFNSVLLVNSRPLSDFMNLTTLELNSTTTKSPPLQKKKRRISAQRKGKLKKNKTVKLKRNKKYSRLSINLDDKDAFFKFS